MIGGISAWQLGILLLIVVLVFGTKRLRNIGSDLGSAVKGFRKGIEDGPEKDEPGKDDPEKLTTEENTSAETQDIKENEPASRSNDV